MDRWALVAAPTGAADSPLPPVAWQWQINHRWQKPESLLQPKPPDVTLTEFNKWKTRLKVRRAPPGICPYQFLRLTFEQLCAVCPVSCVLQQPAPIFSAPSVSHYRLRETKSLLCRQILHID